MHGRAEGRLSSGAALRAQLRSEHGTLPDDFDAAAYLHYNPDLSASLDSPERALDHYMRIGRQEGRPYGPRLDKLVQEFEELRCRGVLRLSETENKRIASGQTTLSVFLRRHGLEPGFWVDQLEVAEFRAMHSHWCGPVTTRSECIVALCERGLSKAPSLSLQRQFDPDFYRAQIGQDGSASAEDLFRHYLNVGSSQGLAPSEATELLGIWGNSEFPTCFDWMSYRAVAGTALRHNNRTEVLKAFGSDATIDHLRFVSPEDSAQFIEWLALRSWHHNGQIDEARRLFLAALERGGSRGSLHQWLGDLEDAAGRTGIALDHYRASSKAPSANRWSFINAASLLMNKGDYKGALTSLEQGRAMWQEGVPWRVVYDRAIRAWFKACAARQPFVSNSFDEPDQLVREIMRRNPDADRFLRSRRRGPDLYRPAA